MYVRLYTVSICKAYQYPLAKRVKLSAGPARMLHGHDCGVRMERHHLISQEYGRDECWRFKGHIPEIGKLAQDLHGTRLLAARMWHKSMQPYSQKEAILAT
jgi:hypothetical protein